MAVKEPITIGERFGRLVVVEVGLLLARDGSVRCRCDCGKKLTARTTTLRRGSASCGCLRKERAREQKTTHGMSRSKMCRAWYMMKERCFDPKSSNYRNYGGRGITVCARWKKDFAAFFADMGERPKGVSKGGWATFSVERIDNDKGYWCGKVECPECGPLGRISNCRWATRSEQLRNKRNNRLLTHDGRTQCVVAWAEETNVADSVLRKRLRLGWSTEKTLTQPLRSACPGDSK